MGLNPKQFKLSLSALGLSLLNVIAIFVPYMVGQLFKFSAIKSANLLLHFSLVYLLCSAIEIHFVKFSESIFYWRGITLKYCV